MKIWMRSDELPGVSLEDVVSWGMLAKKIQNESGHSLPSLASFWP
jgi:hypothetical protein